MEKINKGLGLRPITYTYAFDKGLGPRLYALKRLTEKIDLDKINTVRGGQRQIERKL